MVTHTNTPVCKGSTNCVKKIVQMSSDGPFGETINEIFNCSLEKHIGKPLSCGFAKSLEIQ